MKNLFFLTLIAAACWTFPACNSSNKTADSVDSAEAVNDSTAVMEDDDSDFMVKAANGGMMEVEAGKLAQQKAQSQAVKDFGARMVADHTKAGDELKTLAAGKNVTLPAVLGEDEQKHLDDMAKLSGKEFDDHYIDMMVKDHDKTVEMFEDAASNAKDADVKNWAAKTLPTLNEHKTAIKAIDDKK